MARELQKKTLKGRATLLAAVLLTSLFVVGRGNALAVPTLQLYIEGATYENSSDTWTIGSSNLTLWVLGYAGSGDDKLKNLSLAAAFSDSFTPVITLTSTTAAPIYFPGFVGIPDPSTPPAVSSGSSGTGVSPLMNSGANLPSHGIYGSGTSFQTFKLGDFTLKDSPIGDYTDGACPNDPSCSLPFLGQINAYDVNITGIPIGEAVHFDAFGSLSKYNKKKGEVLSDEFAPFSHDAETTPGTPVPEPATLMLLGSGLVSMGWFARKQRKNDVTKE